LELTYNQYVEDVLAGRVVCNRLTRLAVERHVRDLEDGAERGLWFDEQAAQLAIGFAGIVRHWKGSMAGQPVILEPWQQFFMACLFGWKRSDGWRRFRTGYLEVARKNGKTTMVAIIGLILLVLDGEPGAEIYSTATKRDQARISHTDAKQFVLNSPALRRELKVLKNNIHSLKSNSKFEPLGKDADSTDGLNPHGVLCDELHAWKTPDLWDVMETALGARDQPLMVAITTAGFDRKSLCYQQHEYLEKILDGVVEDDSYFGMIYGLDVEDLEDADSWKDPDLWGKANPNLGVSKKVEQMVLGVKRASEMPARLNKFLRLELNVWTQAENRWIHPDAWAKCGLIPLNEKRLIGRRCYAGLDLSSNTDITALVLVFPPVEDDPYWWVLPRFWIPEDSIYIRSRRDRVPYEAWLRAGLVVATPGNVIDYDWILHDVEQLRDVYELVQIAFDRWGSKDIMQRLLSMGGEEFAVEFGQGFASMSPPMKELEKLILSELLGHGGNPVLAWMAHNLVAREDPAGNLKPDKAKSIEKIDGMVALVMGLDRAIADDGPQDSVYEDRGLRTI